MIFPIPMHKPLDESTLYFSMIKFCAYRERCSLEVIQKLTSGGATAATIKKILKKLKEEQFLDDERFAESYARGKFRMNKWGKNKISMELKMRKIPEATIAKALSGLDETHYEAQVKMLAEKKAASLQYKNLPKRELVQKVRNFLLSKGYSFEQFNPILKELWG